MANRLKHPCNYPGCSALTLGRFCDKHQQAEQKRFTQEHPARDDSYYKSAAWQHLRDAFAQAHPFCADPYHVHNGQQVPMKVVDHIIPRTQGGKDTWENLQSLCRPCHARKSIDEGSRYGGRGQKSLRSSTPEFTAQRFTKKIPNVENPD